MWWAPFVARAREIFETGCKAETGAASVSQVYVDP